MKRGSIFRVVALSSLLVILCLSLGLSSTFKSQGKQKIVAYKKWFYAEADQEALLLQAGAVKIKHLRLINGTSAFLTPQAEKALKKRSEVLRIDDDLIISANGKDSKKKPKPQPPEELTWGIARIKADLAWPQTKGSGIKVAVMDTGIDLDHPDLLDNTRGDVNMIKPKKSGDDDDGHGTHVAGIVAGVDNDIGVIGTGPEIYLYAVKVLDHKGRGRLSDLIDGLNWCIENDMHVVNMSFGSLDDNESFHEAILNVYQAGIVQIASAGNNGEYGGDIEYPGRYPETIAVGAMDESSQIAAFSSFGAELDLVAPGVNIKSTYEKSSYVIMEGTSMAAPHVTGAAALLLKTSAGIYDWDGDGIWDPDEVRFKLKATAEDLGWPLHLQGAGLVRADLVVF